MPTIFESKKDHLLDVLPHKSFERGSSHRYLHSFCIRPHVRFESQHEDEQVILLLRAHPITQIPWVIAVIILVLVPLFLNIFIVNFFVVRQILFANILWYSFIFSYVIVNILNYLFNVGIVTNHRIVDIDFINILYKEVDETILSKVEDVTTRTSGFIRSFFHFGDLTVQTAGAVSYIDFLGIPDPTDAATIINELMRANME